MPSLKTLSIYYTSLLIVMSGVVVGVECIPRRSHPHQEGSGFLAACCNWDGVWYCRIARDGYTYDPSRHSSVAFFPAFPLVAGGLARMFNLSPEAALLLVSHTCLLCGLFVFAQYVSDRYPDAATNTLLTCALWPTGMFLRMGYSESLFFLLCSCVLLGIERRWHWLKIAFLVGIATATRSVGIALVPLAVWQLWNLSNRLPLFALRLCVSGPICISGLLFYLEYQNVLFGDPIAFIRTQAHWSLRPDVGGLEKIVGLALLEPLWGVYTPSSEVYWARYEYIQNAWVSFQFWNPLYFGIAVVAVIFGAFNKWLTTYEVLLGAGLLLIPYALQGYRMGMYGHGRFTCVVLPAFIVLGRGLRPLSVSVQAAAYAIMSVQLFYWSALFAAWYRVF